VDEAEMNMTSLLYKPVGLVVSVLGGVAAGAAFKKVWSATTGEKEAPEATDKHFGWTEVLIAATVQGAIFGLVKAAVDRGGAAGYRRLTGSWPGQDSGEKA